MIDVGDDRRGADAPGEGGRERLRSIFPAAFLFAAFFAVVGTVSEGEVFNALSSTIWWNVLTSGVMLAGSLAISFALDRVRARRGSDSWTWAIGLAALTALVSEPLDWAVGQIPIYARPPHPNLVHLDLLVSGFLSLLLWVLAHLSIRSGDRAIVQERRIAAAREAMIRSETEALLLSLDPAVLLDALGRIGEHLSGGAVKTAAATVIALAEHMRGSLSKGQAEEAASAGVAPPPSPHLLFDEARARRLFRFWTLVIFAGLGAAVLAMAATAPRKLFDYYLHLLPQPALGATWCMVMESVLDRGGRRSPKRAFVEAAALCSAGVALSIVVLLAATAAMGAFHRPYFVSAIPAFEVFYVGPALAAWSATWFILDARRREIARLRAEAEIREAALKARNAVLRQQINPHFLFNALNALYALILGGERERALGVIGAIGRFVERAGDHGDGDFVPLSSELATQDAYLDIERVRFGERLKVERRVSAELESAQVPHLILQPLVENAVKYGVGRTPEPVRVEIAAERAGEALVLSVRDSGAPEAAARPPGLGVGLKNVEERLRSLYGDAATLVCRPLSPSGFLAEVRMPLVL